MRVELSECAEDERLSNGVRGQRRVCWCMCSHNVSQCNKVGVKPFANHHHVPLSKYSRFSPCALLFLQVPTTVSSALALLLVTTSVLTRTTLPPPVRPAGHGNPPMR